MSESYVTLGQICDKGSSNIAQKDLAEREGKYPIYGAAGFIKNVDFAHQKRPYIAVVKDGAGIGRVMKLPANSSVIGTMQYIFPKENVDIDYLFYALQYMNLGKYFSGSTIPHIYFRDYQKGRLKLPAMKVQQHQAETLSRIDTLFSCRQKQIALLAEIVKSRFVEMFGDPLHPVHSRALGDVAVLERGRFSPRPRNDPRYYGGDYPFIQTGDIAGCGHRLSEYRQTLNEKGIHVSKKFSAGTIVIAIVGATIGATAILEIDVYAPDSVIGISVNDELYNNVFMEALLQFWQPELVRIAPESARANINLGILQSIPIIDVELPRQIQFAAFVAQVDKSKVEIQKAIDQLEILKKSLMQQYFG